MSIAVYIGHTGQRLELDPSGSTTSLEDLRSWIASQADVQPRNQILLTAHGKQVRAQTLLTESELFVFDSEWLNGDKAACPADDTASNDFHPGSAPDTITNEKDLQSWQNLFRLRKSWAAGLLNGCTSRSQQAELYREQQDVIERSLAVAVQSLQHHVKSAEKQFAGAETRAQDPLREYQAHVENWEHNLGSLRDVPARAEFTRFIPPMTATPGSRRLSQQHISTLQGFVDVVAVKQAATAARSTLGDLSQKLDKMRRDIESAALQSGELLETVDRLNNRSLSESASEPAQLVDEIGLVAQKMASDFDHVQSLPKSSINVSSASKMALLHTKKYVPSLLEYCAEMNELVHKNKQRRDSAAESAWEHMRTLSVIESQLAKLFHDVKELHVPEDQQAPFDTLNVVSRLPSVYGQLLVESVRRREWVAKMKRDCSTLQEEVAAYQDEEEKRRKKWMRMVEDVVIAEALQTRALGIELSLQNEGGSWPMTTRDELEQYLATLLQVYGQSPVTDEIDQAIKDLDKPTRKQIKHAKAFKNGSMHEAAFGDTSLLLRGDEQYKGLRDMNARLEEDLKTQRSRVRKLEDLLHRQTQASRASAGEAFTPTSDNSYRLSTPPISNVTPQLSEDYSRHNSLSKRRPSLAGGMEEKRLAKRVVDLEAELQSHRNEAASRKSSDAEFQKQVEEATSTKKDLMENMEAQQREFATERRGLEKELAESREKIDELENEIERLMGSRDGIDEENARLKEDAAGHAARAATEHDARNALERRLQIAEEAKAQAEAEVERLRLASEQKLEFDAEQQQLLATAHAHLCSEAETPNDVTDLAIALEELARKSGAHNKDLAEAVAFARSENESLRAGNERYKSELATAAERQIEAEDTIREIKEKLTTEEVRVKSMEQQLGDEQQQLEMLRNKFAEGETGSEVLRQRISEEETKSRSLSSELAESKSHINSLDIELMRLQKKHRQYHASAEASSDRLQQRAERAKELSQRVYLQNQRLGRLLERLGLVVSYQGDTMTIDRASKMAASTMILDQHAQMIRQASVQSPPPTRKTSSADTEPAADLRLLHWPDAPEAEEEMKQFDAFMRHISRFDLDVFADAVTKRVKDFEYTAKKYSKEAKESTKRADAYKERAVKLRNEAHAKIAVRDFKEGDLALFLPTRGGQVKGAWAAFNIGCPHYFLAERDGMRLGTRDFIVARIQKVEQKVVDLTGQRSGHVDGRSIDETSDAPSSMHVEDDNPFDLSDGLTWWMVHASEERGAGAAPTTPGLGKSTVAAANVDATGSINPNRSSRGADASKRLNKSLDSRRSSTASKKGNPPTTPTAPVAVNTDGASHYRSESQTSSLGQQQQQHPPKPLPVAAGSGLGITANASEQASPQHEQIRKISSTNNPQDRPSSSSSRRTASPDKNQARARSGSPSKSIRSLQRHLEQQPLSPPVKASPAKGKSRAGAGWESLFTAEFSLESPSKEKKSLA